MVPSRSALTALKTFMASMTHRVAPVTTLEPTSTKGGSAGEEDRYTVPARGALTIKASASRSRTTFGADGAFEAGAIAGCVSGVRSGSGTPHEPECPAVLGDLHFGEISRGHRVDQRLDLGQVHRSHPAGAGDRPLPRLPARNSARQDRLDVRR